MEFVFPCQKGPYLIALPLSQAEECFLSIAIVYALVSKLEKRVIKEESFYPY